MRTRTDIEHALESGLAPYAARSSASLGRKVAEEQHPYRTAFQRDRARIIHSSAFRRLDGKTQVFLNGTGDHFRTRLTHTIEVASVTRSIARALGLNEDLAEAVALAHDLGHPPFGHAGERELDHLMREHGGFDHNEQSLRVVELLEEKYPRFPGLNLSFEVIEGLRKHASFQTGPDGVRWKNPSLEGQVADIADEITYYSHDLDDGLDSGFLKPEELARLDLWNEAVGEAASGFHRKLDPVAHRGYIIRCLTNREVDDVVAGTAARLQKHHIESLDQVRNFPRPLVGFSADLRGKNAALRRFLYRNFYENPGVAGVHERCCLRLRSEFQKLCAKPSLLGRKAARRVRAQGLERTVCDYLAGMTDRYLLAGVP